MNTLKQDLPDTKVPEVLGRLINTPEMQALIALSRLEHVKWDYWGYGSNILQICDRYTREDFDSETWALISKQGKPLSSSMAEYKHDGFIGDVETLCAELQGWNEVRELTQAWFLHSRSVKYLYAHLCELWKASRNDLDIWDKEIFWYSQREMEGLIAFWVPIFSFSPFVNRSLDELLGKDVTNPELELFLSSTSYDDVQKQNIRDKVVVWDDWGQNIVWPRTNVTCVSRYTHNLLNFVEGGYWELIPHVWDYNKLLESITELWIIDNGEQYRFLTWVLWFQEWNYFLRGENKKSYIFSVSESLVIKNYDEVTNEQIPEDTILVRKIIFLSNLQTTKKVEDIGEEG